MLQVRGVTHYVDSHRESIWEPYAAATATAYTKMLLQYMPVDIATPSYVQLLLATPLSWVTLEITAEAHRVADSKRRPKHDTKDVLCIYCHDLANTEDPYTGDPMACCHSREVWVDTPDAVEGGRDPPLLVKYNETSTPEVSLAVLQLHQETGNCRTGGCKLLYDAAVAILAEPNSTLVPD